MNAADNLALQQHFLEKLLTTVRPNVKFEENNLAVVPYKPVGRLLNPKSATIASGTPTAKMYSANSVSISPADRCNSRQFKSKHHQWEALQSK